MILDNNVGPIYFHDNGGPLHVLQDAMKLASIDMSREDFFFAEKFEEIAVHVHMKNLLESWGRDYDA